ncbi:hypothetical protein AAC387_Pa05g1132 [Persea americana]
MRARIHSVIIDNKSKNLGKLLEASMEAETVIKDFNSQKASKKETTAIPTSKPKKKEVLNVQTKSTPQPPKKAENKAEKAQTKQEVPGKAETSSTASLGATKKSLPKASRVVRKFTLSDFMPPRLRDEATQGASYSCNSVVGFSMNGYESSDTASDNDELEESLETGEYLSDEEWIPESHLMPMIWYNPFQPQGSWSDDDEDQEAVQENAINPALANALVDLNEVEPQEADEEEDLAPMPDLEEYARILQRLAIEQEQDRINQLHQNPELEVPENLQAPSPVTPKNEESC